MYVHSNNVCALVVKDVGGMKKTVWKNGESFFRFYYFCVNKKNVIAKTSKLALSFFCVCSFN
jgi:hypothetical protein